MRIRRVVPLLAVSAVAVLGVGPDHAFAHHSGAEVTCVDLDGYVYEFTLATTQTGAGFDTPASFNVLLFEQGGVLTPTSMFVNGQLLFSLADTGRDLRQPTDVTCTYSFTTEQGVFDFVVTGLLNIP